ncbi:LysM peptidoglycan-binding domain-containing protein [Agromyces sp. NPDC049794]|uniref:LysM peptidoglycan-binding domain-containing protein n=1 Tax=unclassified Agromyces TaxID=2639701 RepID=UPI0033E250A8
MSAAIVSGGFGTSVRPHSTGAPSSTAAPSSSPTRLRLTRRGRIVFTTLGGLPLVVWALVTILGSGGAAADAGVELGARTFEYVTVHQGDSLWAIAESVAPHGDPRDVIAEIMRLNGLDEATVEPGQRLALPVVP